MTSHAAHTEDSNGAGQLWSREPQPITIVDGPHRCSLCGDPLHPGDAAYTDLVIDNTPIGPAHQCCCEEMSNTDSLPGREEHAPNRNLC